jgi:hypothetical protein
VPERSRESRGLGQPPGAASATPLRITRPARFCTALCSSPSAPPWVHSGAQRRRPFHQQRDADQRVQTALFKIGQRDAGFGARQRRVQPGGCFPHAAKAMVIDRKVTLTGSMNWSASARNGAAAGVDRSQIGIITAMKSEMIEGSARSRVMGAVDGALQERGITQKPD